MRMGVLVCRVNNIMHGKTRGDEYMSDLGVCMAGKFPGTSSQGKTVYDLKGCPHVDFTYGNHMWTPHVDTKTTCGPSYTMLTYEVYI